MRLERRGHEMPPLRSFFIGRWQPMHEGHVRLIRTALGEGRQVVIGIMDTELSVRNPYSLAERQGFFLSEFGEELADGRMTVLVMPWIDEVVHGRNVGWRCREIRLDAATEALSGTALRKGEV